jgi:hypothetical protein
VVSTSIILLLGLVPHREDLVGVVTQAGRHQILVVLEFRVLMAHSVSLRLGGVVVDFQLALKPVKVVMDTFIPEPHKRMVRVVAELNSDQPLHQVPMPEVLEQAQAEFHRVKLLQLVLQGEVVVAEEVPTETLVLHARA